MDWGLRFTFSACNGCDDKAHTATLTSIQHESENINALFGAVENTPNGAARDWTKARLKTRLMAIVRRTCLGYTE